jgi:hypothetical protein
MPDRIENVGVPPQGNGELAADRPWLSHIVADRPIAPGLVGTDGLEADDRCSQDRGIHRHVVLLGVLAVYASRLSSGEAEVQHLIELD